MTLVMKFGGSTLLDGKSVRRVAELIADHLAREGVVAVVSALEGVTDQLIEAAEEAKAGNRAGVEGLVGELRRRHLASLRDAVAGGALRERGEEAIEGLLKELELALTSIANLGELTPRSRDYVLSFGERLSAILVASALEELGVKARSLTGWAAGIMTDDAFGEATPLMEVTKLRVKERLVPVLDRGEVPVVTGFIASTQDGAITTLGRGGSDYTATILGSALGAREVQIWTNVDGLMTADPDVVPSARTIPELSFAEAAEMAVLGGKFLHPKSFDPVMAEGIPTRIKNALNPDNPGTLVVREAKVEPGVAKAVTLVRDVALLTVSGFGMVGAPGTAAKVFDVMGKNGINILMISQSVSEANISFVVKRDKADKAASALELALLGKGLVREVSVEDDVCVVAVVGSGMRGKPGVAARIFGAVAREGINVRMIAQGSSELNVSFVVNEADCERAVRAIHAEFGLDKPFIAGQSD